MTWTKFNIFATVISAILVTLDFITSDGNIESWTTTNEILSGAGLLFPIIILLITNPIIFIVLALKKKLSWKKIGLNLLILLIHMGISSWFFINALGRAFF